MPILRTARPAHAVRYHPSPGRPFPLPKDPGPRDLPDPGRGTPWASPAVLGGGLLGPGARGGQNPQNWGIWAKTPKKGVFGPLPGVPRKRAFLDPPGNRGAPARGVDVKPPSRGPPAGSKKAVFWPKRPKMAKKPENRLFGHFSGFWGVFRPLRASRTRSRGGVLHQPLAPGPRGSRRAGSPTPSRGPGARRAGEPHRGVGGPLPRSGA